MGAVPARTLVRRIWFPPDVTGVRGYSSHRPMRSRHSGFRLRPMSRPAREGGAAPQGSPHAVARAFVAANSALKWALVSPTVDHFGPEWFDRGVPIASYRALKDRARPILTSIDAMPRGARARIDVRELPPGATPDGVMRFYETRTFLAGDRCAMLMDHRSRRQRPTAGSTAIQASFGPICSPSIANRHPARSGRRPL